MFHWTNLFHTELEKTQAHCGEGEILTKRILQQNDINGYCNFIDMTVMPPHTTIGLHTHRLDEEEFYLILYGSGVMQSDSETLKVEAGALIRNRPGGSHSLENTGDKPLGLFVFELQAAL